MGQEKARGGLAGGIMSETSDAYEQLYETVKTLRAEGGCPWDRAQTPLSMRSALIEEAFEAADAVTQNDAPHAKEELGDVMLNAVLIAYMYEQSGDFTVAQVLESVTEKLIRRHPHVFPQSEGASCMTEEVKTGDQVISQWDRIKEEVEGRGTGRTVLDEVPEGFPPLLRAYKMQKKAAKLGFDWKTMEPVRAKVYEELHETEEAEQEHDQHHLEEEFGDLMFAVLNYMRHLGVDPEIAMDRVNRKFYRRFSYVEQHMKDAGIPLDSSDESLKAEEQFWDDAKKQGL